jgi:hypothetical protein
VECLRYDYRGIGESTGAFEQMSFEHWLQDAEVLTNWLKGRSPGLPVLLHGLEMGALLAAKAFDAGIGDGLLLWSPPANANQSLRGALMRRVAMDHAFHFGQERKPVSEYLKRMESGEFLEVEGYNWTARLWKDSFRMELPAKMADGARAEKVYGKPVRIVKLDSSAAPLVKGSAVSFDSVSKDFSALFEDNFAWIAGALGSRREGDR